MRGIPRKHLLARMDSRKTATKTARPGRNARAGPAETAYTLSSPPSNGGVTALQGGAAWSGVSGNQRPKRKGDLSYQRAREGGRGSRPHAAGWRVRARPLRAPPAHASYATEEQRVSTVVELGGAPATR